MAFPELEVRVFDIAGNEMANTVGGGLQYVVGQLVGSLLSFFLGPTLAGTVMGFFVGFVAGIFEDLSIFLQIGEIFEGLKSIGTLIPTLLENPGMIWEMIKDSLYGIINKAFNFNPAPIPRPFFSSQPGTPHPHSFNPPPESPFSHPINA